jgi:hypothetical protein
MATTVKFTNLVKYCPENDPWAHRPEPTDAFDVNDTSPSLKNASALELVMKVGYLKILANDNNSLFLLEGGLEIHRNNPKPDYSSPPASGTSEEVRLFLAGEEWVAIVAFM